NVHLIGRVNALLARGVTADLDRNLGSNLDLDDWGLVLHDPESRTADLFRRLSRPLNLPFPLGGRGGGVRGSRTETDRLTLRQWKGRVARSFAQEADWQSSLSAFVAALDMTPLSGTRFALQQPVLTRQNVKTYFERRGYLSLESHQLLLDAET